VVPQEPVTATSAVTIEPAMLREMRAAQKGSIDVYKAILERGREMKFTREELRQIQVEREKCFAPRFSLMPKDLDGRVRCHHRNMSKRKYPTGGEEWWCELCHKWATEEHCTSILHCQKLDEQAAVDEMVGPAGSARRFANEPGLMHLSARNFLIWWGLRIPNLPSILMDRLGSGHEIAIRWGGVNCKPKMLRLADVESVGLIAVSFMPFQTGRYNEGTDDQDVAVRWDILKGEESPMVDHPHFERLIDPNDEVKLSAKVPKGHGWWPAVDVRWKTQADDFWSNRADYFQAIEKGEIPIWAPCGYQIWDGSRVIDAWPIRLVSRM